MGKTAFALNLATNVAIVVEYSTDSDILGIFLKDFIYLF